MKGSGNLPVEDVSGVLVARLTSESVFDPVSIEQLSRVLLVLIADHKPRQIVIAFDDVTLCSTGVINTLLVVKKRLLCEGGEMKLCGVSDNIRHTFRILNLDGTVFRIYDTVEDALAAFAASDDGI
jgi:anti-anti-sigma factor